jgi:hypothetical protein
MGNVKRCSTLLAVGALALVAVGCGASATARPTVGPADFSFSLISFAPLPTFALTTPAATPTVAPPLWGVDSQGIPLPPPDASGVDQALITAAPLAGPFKIDPKAGPSGWPDACNLTTEAQLKALDPAITGVAGTPVGQKATMLGGSGGVTPNNADCKWTLATTYDAAYGAGSVSYVDISFWEIDSGAPQTYRQALADAQSNAKQYPAQFGSYQNLPGGTSCFYNGNELQCLKGDVDFDVMGSKFSGAGMTDSVTWIQEILLPLAEKLGSEIS